MTAQILAFPDRSAILIDQSPFGGGYEAEPYLCPAASGRGSWFASFVDAFEYAEALAAEVESFVFFMCELPDVDGPTGGQAA